ncbi:MAG: MarR family winged helix-turn-helix transcriptional regulator [Bdellovibrionota bacterium]
MNQVQSIMDSFRRIVRALRTSSRISESHLGLRTAQVFVLQQLERCEPVSLNELAEKTYSHQSTVSVVVNTLVKKGYVCRKAREGDRRFLVLETTAKGKALLKKQSLTIQEQFSSVIQNMEPKERKELARLLELFVTSAGLGKEPPHFFFEKEAKSKLKNRF